MALTMRDKQAFVYHEEISQITHGISIYGINYTG